MAQTWKEKNEQMARDQQNAAAQAEQNKINYEKSFIDRGGWIQDSNMLRRQGAYNYGSSLGQKEFYDDPDMKMIRGLREDLSKGYEGAELGALRGEARGQVAGQASNYLRQMQGQQARGGVGGARAAAQANAAKQGFAQQGADAERKLLLDAGQVKRQGVSDLQDFISRQKLGKLGLAYGQQALSSADYGAEKGVQAAQSGGKK